MVIARTQRLVLTFSYSRNLTDFHSGRDFSWSGFVCCFWAASVILMACIAPGALGLAGNCSLNNTAMLGLGYIDWTPLCWGLRCFLHGLTKSNCFIPSFSS